MVITRDAAGRIVKVDAPVPTTVIGRDIMRFTVTADGKRMTQEARSVDANTRKPYRYLLLWDKVSN